MRSFSCSNRKTRYGKVIAGREYSISDEGAKGTLKSLINCLLYVLGRLLFKVHDSLTYSLIVEQVLHLSEDLSFLFLEAHLTLEELVVDTLFIGESGVLSLGQPCQLFLISLFGSDGVEAEARDLDRIVFERTFVLDHLPVSILDKVDEVGQRNSLNAAICRISQI